MSYLGARRACGEERFSVSAAAGQDDQAPSVDVVRHVFRFVFRGDQGRATTSERQPGASERDEILVE